MQRDVTGANTALSFIDVLASALGAAVLLFVILASTPVSVPGRAQAAGTFIRYEWTVVGDPGALLRIAIKSPVIAEPTFIDLQNFSGQAVHKCERELPGLSSYLLMGFARDAIGGGTIQNHTYVLRLNQPTPGDWQVSVLYYDRASDILSAPSEIHVDTAVSSDSASSFQPSDVRKTDVLGNGPQPVGVGAVIIKFGDQLLAPLVQVSGKKGVNNGC
jgi:hypothetical protein